MKCSKSSWQKHILSALVALFACAPMIFAQQEVTVTGKVVDEDNFPLAGVSVIQVGTLNGVITDSEGVYSITTPDGSSLEFSFIGYLTRTLKVTSKTMNVDMVPETKSLDESVVIGYGAQKRSSITGAISSVTSEDFTNRTATTLQAAMQGKTSGVQIIQTSGAPGKTPVVRVRGYSSNAGSDPLFVVDGVRLTDIDNLDPNDIESMEVLKDAASAAIYGAEAGNGVVLITTKRGKSGQGRISYDYQLTIQTPGRTPKLLNAQEYINYMTEGGWLSMDQINSSWDGVTDTDWADATFTTSLMHKHNFSLSNGNDKGNYYVSLSYLSNDGTLRGNSDIHKRFTGVANGEWKIKEWLTVGTTNQFERYTTRGVSDPESSAVNWSRSSSVMSDLLSMDPLTRPTYAANALPQSMQNLLDNGYTLLQDKKGNYYGISEFAESGVNPLITRDSYSAETTGFRINGSAYLDFKPFKFLTYTSRLGYRFEGYNYSETDFPYYGNSSYFSQYLTELDATSATTFYYQWENFINYNQTFGKHTVGAMIGMSFQKNTYDYTSGSLSANGGDAVSKRDPGFYYLKYPSSTSTQGVDGNKEVTAKLSYFARVNYEYGGRYIVQASFRADAADLSYLPKDNRWGFFPAVSAGWVISEEKWFSGVKDKVNQLKLRASWGQNGSLASLGNYMYSTYIRAMTGASTGYFFESSDDVYVQPYIPNSMGNYELKWETSEQYDIGIDALFFNNRFSFSVDWYNKTTKDLIVSGTTPSLAIGGTTSPVNAGNVSNRGLEFDLGWKDTKGDFFYSIRANVSTLRNRVTYLDESLTRIEGTSVARWTNAGGATYFEKGYPIYYFMGYVFDKVDPTTGDPTFKDINGDGVINENDRTYIGDGIPRVTYGITLNFALKGIDLLIFGSGTGGNDIWYRAGGRIRDIVYTDHWTTSNTSGSIPRPNSYDSDKYENSSAMIFDGSYFKIKQIQLGYTFPRKWMSKIRVNTLRIYASLDDFITFTSYPGFDPEAVSTDAVSGIGLDTGIFPNPRKVVFGVNLEF